MTFVLGRFRPFIGHENPQGEQGYSSTVFFFFIYLSFRASQVGCALAQPTLNIYTGFIPSQLMTKHLWLLLQFIVLLIMDAKGVRNMQSILAVVNKHNTARVASCWFTIYYIILYYSSTLFFASALEGVEGSASHPGRTLPPGRTRYPLYRRLGGPQGRSGQVMKISSPPGFDPRTVQPVGSRYTDYSTRPTHLYYISLILSCSITTFICTIEMTKYFTFLYSALRL